MIAWIAVALTVTGLILNGRKLIICWPIWIGSNVLWISHYWGIDYASITVNLILFAANVFGWRHWAKSELTTRSPPLKE